MNLNENLKLLYIDLYAEFVKISKLGIHENIFLNCIYEIGAYINNNNKTHNNKNSKVMMDTMSIW